ncbi:MAG: rhomboid family intramembrane serine protease [Candidatus Hydrogenedentes bacterium]|nr:rhomboid family intramembrane serine protease [Candidatus Hydrogenedentota bacterium]
MNSYYQEESRFGLSRSRVTYGVQFLILANLCVFALQLLLDIPLGNPVTFDAPGGSMLIERFSFSADRFREGWVWTPLTYMFVHGGLQHLFFNMLLLFFFGPDVERLLGTRQFLRFYFLCGFVGVLLNLLSAYLFGIHVSIVGASGAIMGVVVAFAIADPDRQIFLFPLPFPITARAMVIFFIVIDLLTVASGARGTSVATHLGGMAVSFAYMKYRPTLLQWSLKRRRKPSKRDRKNLGEAVDNIFKFQDKERKK